jgi:hypothetical protein
MQVLARAIRHGDTGNTEFINSKYLRGLRASVWIEPNDFKGDEKFEKS